MSFLLLQDKDRIRVIAVGGTIAHVFGDLLLPLIQPRYWPDRITPGKILAEAEAMRAAGQTARDVRS